MNAFQKASAGQPAALLSVYHRKPVLHSRSLPQGKTNALPDGPEGHRSAERSGKSLSRFNAHKARLHPAVPLHGLTPHGGRAHPEAALTVQSAVHHHFLFGLAVPGHAQHLVFIAFEMPVAARQNVVFEWFHFHPRFRSFVHDVITKRIIAYFRAAKKPFAGKMRKKVCGGCLHCRAANAILKR